MGHPIVVGRRRRELGVGTEGSGSIRHKEEVTIGVPKVRSLSVAVLGVPHVRGESGQHVRHLPPPGERERADGLEEDPGAAMCSVGSAEVASLAAAAHSIASRQRDAASGRRQAVLPDQSAQKRPRPPGHSAEGCLPSNGGTS